MCRKAVLTPEKEVPAEKRADEALVSEETFELDEDSVVLSDWMPITEQKPLKRGLYVVTYLNKRGVASTKFAFWDKRREQWFLFCRRATGKLFAPPCETVIAWHKMPADNHFAKGPGDWGWVANRDPIVRRGTFLCLVKSEEAAPYRDQEGLRNRSNDFYEGKWRTDGWRNGLVVERWLKLVEPYRVGDLPVGNEGADCVWRLKSLPQTAKRDAFIHLLEENLTAACREQTGDRYGVIKVSICDFLPGGMLLPKEAMRKIVLRGHDWSWFAGAEPVVNKLVAVEFVVGQKQVRKVMRFDGQRFIDDATGEKLSGESSPSLRWRYRE